MSARADIDPYRAELARLDARLRSDPPWMRPIREAAAARFRELGFPTTREEDWKYTNVAPWIGARAGAAEPARDEAPAAAGLVPTEDLAARLSFVDGRFSPEGSQLGVLAGCRVGRLADAVVNGDADVGRHLARHASFDRNGFTALATALFEDGAFVVVPDRVRLDRPIEVVFASTRASGDVAYPRLLVVCGRESRATIVETHRSEAESRALANVVAEIVLDDGAVLDHVRIVADAGRAAHVATTDVVLGRDSRYASSAFALRGAFVRHGLNVRLEGEGAECSLDGLYLASGEEFVDNHTAIDHAVPHGTSRQLYKGILAGAARAVFNGKVMVRPGAQKTDAQQTNRNLLLSTRAEIDTKPELQIFADDVKCAHGAAIGQLDPQALFYMKSRGIGEIAGRKLLTLGFGNEMVSRIALESLRPVIERLVAERVDADLLEDR